MIMMDGGCGEINSMLQTSKCSAVNWFFFFLSPCCHCRRQCKALGVRGSPLIVDNLFSLRIIRSSGLNHRTCTTAREGGLKE